jgi:drug/metabolite transporter (DMT)-like permease
VTPFVYSIALVIASQVAYQLAVKSIPRDANPFGILILVYGLALVVCIALAPFVGKPIVFADMKRFLSWPACLLALTVVGIEVGYLLAYRSGWTLGITFAVTSVAAVSVLALFGVAWFGEHLDGRRIAGLMLALAGGYLVVARS